MIVVRTYLELRRAWSPPGDESGGDEPRDHDRGATRLELARADHLTPRDYRALYAAVGSAYRWHDRDAWSDAQLAVHLADPRVSLYLATIIGDVAGYAELVRDQPGERDCEIAYFGLLPEWHGRGLGRALLEQVIAAAWRSGAERLWLHTCTLDAPAALPNYRARGFRPFREERYEVSD